MQVVFDVGGVLLDWNPERYVRECFPELAADRVAAQVFGSQAWRDLDAGRTSRAAVEHALVEQTALAASQVTALLDGMPQSLRPIVPMIELVHGLHEASVPVYVLSNMPAYVQQALDRDRVLPEVFSGRLFSHAHRMLKPEPQIYQQLLNDHGLAAQECIFIDDLPANLHAAAAAGLQTVHMAAATATAAEAAARQVRRLLGVG